jgi:hypothetical protein
MKETLLIFAAFSGNPEHAQAFSETIQTQKVSTPVYSMQTNPIQFGTPINYYSGVGTITTCVNGQCSVSAIPVSAVPPAETGFRPFGGFFRRR